MTLTHRLALTALFAGAAAFAQTSTGSTSTPASGIHSTAPASDMEAVKSATKMTPSGVLSLIHLVNQDEIKLGKIAELQAQNDKVKGYAKDMVDDHSALDKKLIDFAQTEGKGKVTLSASQIPAAKHQEMTASSQKAEAKLKSATGPAFDRDYMSTMLKGHDTVLADLDAALPSLKENDKVHSLVSDARDKVKMHRDHARDILNDLERGTATGGSGMQGGSTGTTTPGTTPSSTQPSTTGH